MKGNYKETMSQKALAHKVLAGNQVGNHKETTLAKEETSEETSSEKFPKKFPNSVARTEQNCQTCQYHDTGPDTFGKGIIHWCGPFKEPGYNRWLNIAELTACPKGKWGEASETVH
jgi:hypothetical protein